MKRLSEISAFPEPARETLETRFGISSAEAFFEHATRNADGIGRALNLKAERVEELKNLVAGYLSPAFVARCQQPAPQHSRGVIVPTK